MVQCLMCSRIFLPFEYVHLGLRTQNLTLCLQVLSYMLDKFVLLKDFIVLDIRKCNAWYIIKKYEPLLSFWKIWHQVLTLIKQPVASVCVHVLCTCLSPWIKLSYLPHLLISLITNQFYGEDIIAYLYLTIFYTVTNCTTPREKKCKAYMLPECFSY